MLLLISGVIYSEKLYEIFKIYFSITHKQEKEEYTLGNYFFIIEDEEMFHAETDSFEDLCATYLTRDESGLHQAQIWHIFHLKLFKNFLFLKQLNKILFGRYLFLITFLFHKVVGFF